MKQTLSLLFFLVFYALGQGLLLNSATSQVIEDGTTSTTVDANGDTFVINNGNQAGTNLFHSFEQFSVPNGGEASFNNADNISNIFSRVTGGSVSSIDGMIRANGNANLFLVNPAGIVFGENASLSIGGSFYGSTADSILFPDGEFSAIAPNNQPILTINAPIGLNLRDNPAEITATGTTEPLSLSVEQGESFNLVGGEIKLDFGVVPLTEGSIELVSVSQASTIGISENNTFDIPDDIDLADISLSDFGLEITAESMDSGILKLTGKSVTLSNGSRLSNTSMGTGSAGNIEVNTSDSLLINTDAGIFSNTFAQGNAGAINVTAGDNITLEGTNTGEPTGIFSGANLNGTILTGSAGEIRLEANNISLSDGAEINTNTFGSGDAGNIFITANAVNIGNNSSIFSAVGDNSVLGSQASGNGGLIDIDTKTLSLSDGATIITQTFAMGSAGTINIDATESINISGVANFPFLFPESENSKPGGFSSGFFSNSEESASGGGGEIIVATPTLKLSDGAAINARSSSNANAGNITVDVDILEITGGSQILATAFSGGDAGNINLDVSEEVLISGIDADFQTRLNTVTEIFGEAEAQFIIDPVSEVSGIFANTSSESTGEGGNIALGVFSTLNNSQSTSEIIISDRGTIAVNSQGSGNSGTISLNAAELTLDSQAEITAQTNVLPENQIDNEIDINLKIDDSLKLREDSLISAQALQANGGNININAADGFVVAFPSQNQGSDIVANAAQTGGNITINSQAVLGLEEGMAFGQSGTRINNESNDLDVTGSIDGIIEIITPDVDTIQGMPETSTNLVDSGQGINQVCDVDTNTNDTTLVVKGKGAIPLKPTEPLSSDEIVVSEEAAKADFDDSNFEELNKNNHQSINTSIGEIIPARGVKITEDGNVILVGYSTDNTQRHPNISANCGRT